MIDTKTITSLKRTLAVGTIVRLVRHDWIPASGGKNGFRIGMERKVVSVDSQKVVFSPAQAGAPTSHCRWPSASDYRQTENGWEIRLGDGDEWMGYEVVA